MGRHAVRVGGLAVAPQLDDGEVVLPVGLGHRLEAQIAIVLAAVLGELLGDRGAVLALRRNDVDMGDDRNRRPAALGGDGSDREREMHALVEGGVLHRFDLVAELGGGGRLGVGVHGGLVLPRFEQHELIELADALQGLGAQISGLLARGVAEPAHQRRRHVVAVGITSR